MSKKQPSLERFKYGLLKLISLSGFKVLDPPVRLAFGEEPEKQIRDIMRYMILPIIFVICCLFTWNIMGPNHKTKSGEVPTPSKVWDAYKDAKRFNERENEKEQAFLITGADRDKELTAVKIKLAELEIEATRLQKEAAEVTSEVEDEIKAAIAPSKKRYDTLIRKNKAAKAERRESEKALAEKVADGEASHEALLKLITKNITITDAEKTNLKALKFEINQIRDNPPSLLKETQLAANKVADEVQHYKKRVDYLTTGNRELKAAASQEKANKAAADLATASTASDALKQAKAAVSNEEQALNTRTQEYPRTATIFWQTKRSIATVFVGFLLAAIIAIPLGIMCGLNRIVMACLTPIISIFRPVSPVVWLLIFQIVVGAFFPDPNAHPLFIFMNNSANPLAFLQTNPAMIFSACTVAMCALWPALVNTALGVSAIDKDYLNVAKVLRLGFWSRLFKIIIPSSLPLVFAGLRISLGVGWMVLIAAEALSSSDGLGKFVWDEYQNGSSQSFANIILACFVVGIIGFFLDRLMIVLQRLASFDDGSATA